MTMPPNHDAAHVSGDRFAGDISVASRAARRWPPAVPVDSSRDRYAIEHPHGNWIVCPRADGSLCGDCQDCFTNEDNDRRFGA